MSATTRWVQRASTLAALTLSAPLWAAVGHTPTSFSVSPSGEANFTVPIFAPAGIRGLAPQLAFTYSHRAGAGSAWMGTGWEISGLSAITRCPKTWAQDGVSRGVGFYAGDRFCLDGQQLKLVSGSYGVAGSVYATEIETFARITAYGVAGYGPAYFVVERKDGSIAEYGTRADSLIEGPNSGGTARVWALSTLRDRANNRVEFNYTEDTTYGSFQIASIAYTTNPTQGITTAPYTVSFTYEIQPTTEVQSGYVGGSFIKDVKRMTRVDVNYGGSTLLRRYNIAYESTLSSASHSRVASITECAGSTGTDCMPATTFNYQNGTSAFNASVAQAPTAVANTRSMIMDINGDGRSDLVYPSAAPYVAGVWMVALGNSSGGFNTATSTTLSSYYSAYSTPIDYNADGKSDMLTTNGTNYIIALSNGSGFDAPIDTGLSALGIRDLRALDIDGDGLDDLVWTAGRNVNYRARVWGGTFSTTVVTLLISPPRTTALYFDDVSHGRNHGLNPDFDGDGHGDLIITAEYQVLVGGEYQPYVLSDVILSASQQVVYLGAVFVSGAVDGDFNGDGITDLAIDGGTSWQYRFGTGGGYMTTAVSGASTVGQITTRAIPTDWDGDGFTDLMVPSTDGTWKIVRSSGESLSTVIATGLAVGALDST